LYSSAIVYLFELAHTKLVHFFLSRNKGLNKFAHGLIVSVIWYCTGSILYSQLVYAGVPCHWLFTYLQWL